MASGARPWPAIGLVDPVADEGVLERTPLDRRQGDLAGQSALHEDAEPVAGPHLAFPLTGRTAGHETGPVLGGGGRAVGTGFPRDEPVPAPGPHLEPLAVVVLGQGPQPDAPTTELERTHPGSACTHRPSTSPQGGQQQGHVAAPRRVAHAPDPPDLPGLGPDPGPDLDAEVGQQTSAARRPRRLPVGGRREPRRSSTGADGARPVPPTAGPSTRARPAGAGRTSRDAPTTPRGPRREGLRGRHAGRTPWPPAPCGGTHDRRRPRRTATAGSDRNTTTTVARRCVRGPGRPRSAGPARRDAQALLRPAVGHVDIPAVDVRPRCLRAT